MNYLVPGTAAAAGPQVRPGGRDTDISPGMPASVDSAPSASVRRASAARNVVAQILDALGIAGGGGPRDSNWRTLSYREFRWYFFGSVASNFGTWLQNTAQVVLAYQLTRSVLAVGLVTCAQFTSPLLLGPWAAVLTHRFGNFRALMATQCGSMLVAATLAALEFGHWLTIGELFAGAVLIGLAFTFALPALSVTVAALVPESETKRALAMDSVSYNLGRALAPVLSVAMFVTIGFGCAFALNAASFLFFIIVLLRQRPNIPSGVNRSRVKNGFSIALHERQVMILLLMVAAVTVAADPILVLGPALARSFGESSAWSGAFIAALGAGNVIGSFRRTRREPRIRRAATVLCILSLSMVIFVTSHWIWLSIGAAFAAGAACLLAGAATKALLLDRAGPGRQAAVMAAWAVAWAGSKPIASLADGTLAGHIGLRLTGIVLAVPAALPALALILIIAFPALGRVLGHEPVREPLGVTACDTEPQPALEPVHDSIAAAIALSRRPIWREIHQSTLALGLAKAPPTGPAETCQLTVWLGFTSPRRVCFCVHARTSALITA